MKLPEDLKLQRKGSGQASKPKGIKSSNIRWVILFFACNKFTIFKVLY